MQNTHLFLDDLRQPGDVTWINIPSTNWAIVRSFQEAVTWVQQNGFPGFISFDHDLGYEEFTTDENGFIIVTKADEMPTGYDFAKWLIDYDLDTKTMPKDFGFTVHSLNPVGAANIERLLNNYIAQK